MNVVEDTSIIACDVNSNHFIDSLKNAENHYLHLVNNGWQPQQARGVLPNALKTEIIMTGFISD